MSEVTEARDALLAWREAPPNSPRERRAARVLAYRMAVLLRSLGVDPDSAEDDSGE